MKNPNRNLKEEVEMEGRRRGAESRSHPQNPVLIIMEEMNSQIDNQRENKITVTVGY